MGRRWVTGWKLDPKERAELLARFEPLFPDVIGDNIMPRTGTNQGRRSRARPAVQSSVARTIGWECRRSSPSRITSGDELK